MTSKRTAETKTAQEILGCFFVLESGAHVGPRLEA